ncbi:MAG TPA: glycosyl hydrolase [Bacteroidia bacterium]|jgi:beta-mannanase|nr:glycosyl hydrolase [Bacteroidia bacterium]
MKIKIVGFVFLFLSITKPVAAQLKFVVEDFEGFADGSSDMKMNGVFTFGNCKAYIEHDETIQRPGAGPDYLEKKSLTIKRSGNENFAGWGKGIGLNIELDATQDYFNFYVHQYAQNGITNVKIEIQEDDNDNNIYEKEFDDSWVFSYAIKNIAMPGWQLVSIPLSKFEDDNLGGDEVFDCNYKNGKLFCIIMSFTDTIRPVKAEQIWYFDFICFSKGALQVESNPIHIDTQGAFCNLGLWSSEGNKSDFTDIPGDFENLFKTDSVKKLGVIHFFQPFSVDGSDKQNNYPSADRINKIVHDGYIPMITLENHFVNTNSKVKQPNLYSITQGYMDNFFINWAKQIKKIEGIVLIRILHEFNGNWYPWCTANNDKNPELVIKAFRHIHDIFKEEQVTNVRFIWCPNSMSVPQEKWNFIMNAYPGNDYVDYVGMDIYNGAGQKFSLWRSFRKEGMENYFTLTENLPDKPLFVCEAASREREGSESTTGQTKAEWILEMTRALKTDMSKIKLLTWFNEKATFRINSSLESKDAFLNYILKDDYFKTGTKYLIPFFNKEN